MTAMAKNSIGKSGSAGVSVLLGGRVDSISKNKISSPKGVGITLESGAKVKKITGNNVKSARKYGIAVAGIKKPVSITKNKVSKSGKYAILVNKKVGKQRVSIKGNKLTGKRSAALVRIEGGKVSVSGSRTSVKPSEKA